MKLGDLRTSEEVLAGALRDPAFRAEWERTAVARALASQVVAYRVKHGLSQRALADELHMPQPRWLGLKRRSTIPKSRRYGASPAFSTLSST